MQNCRPRGSPRPALPAHMRPQRSGCRRHSNPLALSFPWPVAWSSQIEDLRVQVVAQSSGPQLPSEQQQQQLYHQELQPSGPLKSSRATGTSSLLPVREAGRAPAAIVSRFRERQAQVPATAPAQVAVATWPWPPFLTAEVVPRVAMLLVPPVRLRASSRGTAMLSMPVEVPQQAQAAVSGKTSGPMRPFLPSMQEAAAQPMRRRLSSQPVMCQSMSLQPVWWAVGAAAALANTKMWKTFGGLLVVPQQRNPGPQPCELPQGLRQKVKLTRHGHSHTFSTTRAFIRWWIMSCGIGVGIFVTPKCCYAVTVVGE